MLALYVRQRCLTLRSAPVPVAVSAVAPKTVSGCSGRHPACRRAVASSPAAKTVGQPHVPEHLATRQNPSVFFRAARMPALYVRQGCLTLRSAPVPVAVSAVAPELVSRATSPRPSPPTPVGGEPAGWKACPTPALKPHYHGPGNETYWHNVWVSRPLFHDHGRDFFNRGRRFLGPWNGSKGRGNGRFESFSGFFDQN